MDSKLKIKVIGNYAPNMKFYKNFPCSCYLIKGFHVPVILDLGMGTFKKLLSELRKENQDIMDAYIIISHNHIDHSSGLIPLSFYLLRYKIKGKLKQKVKVYLPQRSMIFSYVNILKLVFDIHIIKEDTFFEIENCKFSFCLTEHKGESYATKLSMKDHIFIYTSDMAYASRDVRKFCEKANCVLIDSGNPCNNKLRCLAGYHGRTREIIEDLLDSQVKRILASHLKKKIEDKEYIKAFPKNANIELIKLKNEYPI